jgi:hypothetical protein
MMKVFCRVLIFILDLVPALASMEWVWDTAEHWTAYIAFQILMLGILTRRLYSLMVHTTENDGDNKTASYYHRLQGHQVYLSQRLFYNRSFSPCALESCRCGYKAM